MKKLLLVAAGAVLITVIGCLAAVSEASGGDPEATLYSLADTNKECHSATSTVIPLYVSVSPNTPMFDVFSVEIHSGGSATLTRIDEVNLLGFLELPAIPTTVRISITRNGEKLPNDYTIQIENAFQAAAISLGDLGVYKDPAPLPPGIEKAIGFADIWGYWMYGTSDRTAYEVHPRDYVSSTMCRAADTGATDVYFTMILRLDEVRPLPRLLPIDSGDAEVTQEDLRMLVDEAHRHGMKLHLVYNAYCPSPDDKRYLWQAEKTELWLNTLLDQYLEIILEDASRAEAAGVDFIVLNWQDATVEYNSRRAVWAARWSEIIPAVGEVFSGGLQFNLPTYQQTTDLISGLMPAETFEGIESFYYPQWEPRFGRADDSISYLEGQLRSSLLMLQELYEVTGIPVVFSANLQSTDRYFVNGWSDVAVGQVLNDEVDFYEQARGFEAIARVISDFSGIVGLSAYKYHWDDPFGPDLPVHAESRMDLSGSIRNKPAEAVIKRWFGEGSTSIGSCWETRPNSPWCPAVQYSQTTGSVDGAEACLFLVDDFESSILRSRLGGTYDYDSCEKHDPSIDTVSSCQIERLSDRSGDYFLSAAYSHENWLKVRLTSFGEFDASEYQGIEITLWADKPTTVDLELGSVSPGREWRPYWLRGLAVAVTPRRFYVPFLDFGLQEGGSSATIARDLARLLEIAVFVPQGEGILNIDDICFY